MKKRVLHWFRNDLRIHDHPVLSKAASFEALLPVYIIDPTQHIMLAQGFKKTGAFRLSFLLETLRALQDNLQKLNSGLLVAIGKPEEILPRLAREIKADFISAQKEDTWEEVATELALEQNAEIPVNYFYGLTLFHPDDIPFSRQSIPEVFTGFRKKCEKEAIVRSCFPLPKKLPAYPAGMPQGDIPGMGKLGYTNVTPHSRTAFPFKGGETSALNRLNDYIWGRELIAKYKLTRNGLLGEAYSSKFSPWLSLGALSPRLIYHEIKRFESEVTQNRSTYWLIFELIWRDFFRFIARKHGKQVFLLDGIKGSKKNWLQNNKIFEQWRKGETGEPFIDANMREMLLTGFMSNRGRQNVASYLCNDLGIDWRWGAAWFESQLIDYDACSNWGNWMYVAGVGNDPREDRYFHPQKQASRYDPDGDYIATWMKNSTQLSPA